MKRLMGFLLIAALIMAPGLAAAQAPAAAPKDHPAAAPAAPQQPQPGAGMTCPMMNPEQMKQMQGQCCAMMQEGKGCPMGQKIQKQLDELSQRVESLEKQGKGKKK